MAERGKQDNPAPEKAAREAAKAAEPAEDADVFPVERLTGPDAFPLTGYQAHEVAGALSGVNKKNLTIEEAQAATKAWLRTPVKED